MNGNITRVIGLDETGEFNYNDDKKFQCIGGLIADFPGNIDDEKINNEIGDISQYYEKLNKLFDEENYNDENWCKNMTNDEIKRVLDEKLTYMYE